jgi:hypothetical protein
MRENHQPHHIPVLEDVEIAIALVGVTVVWIAWFIARDRYHFSNRQIAELVSYFGIALVAIIGTAVLIATRHSYRERPGRIRPWSRLPRRSPLVFANEQP